MNTFYTIGDLSLGIDTITGEVKLPHSPGIAARNIRNAFKGSTLVGVNRVHFVNEAVNYFQEFINGTWTQCPVLIINLAFTNMLISVMCVDGDVGATVIATMSKDRKTSHVKYEIRRSKEKRKTFLAASDGLLKSILMEGMEINFLHDY